MDDEFENDIEQAFRLQQREVLKERLRGQEARILAQERLFEQDLPAAFQLDKRAFLKTRLQTLESGLEQLPESVPVRRIGHYWRYAAAASVIVVVGLGFYLTRESENSQGYPENQPSIAAGMLSDSALNADKNSDVAVLSKPDSARKNSEDATVDDQVGEKLAYVANDFPVLAGTELGFSQSKKESIRVVQQLRSANRDTILFRLVSTKLTLKVSRQQTIRSVLTYQNELYIHIGSRFYNVRPTTEFQRLAEIADPTVLTELEKIEFQN